MANDTRDSLGRRARRWIRTSAAVMAGALTVGVLTLSTTAALAPPAGASTVGNAALCLYQNPMPIGCVENGGSTSGPENTTPSYAWLTFTATSGLTGSDTVTVTAPAGGQFQQSGGYDFGTGTIECTPSSVNFSNSNTTVTIGVRSACATSAGAGAYVLFVSALTLPSTAASCAQWQVSTTEDTQATSTSCITVTSVPGAPTSPQASGGERRLTLSWTAPTNTGELSLTGYDVYCSASGPPSTSGTPTATVASSSTSVTVYGLTNRIAYQCVVTAVNSVGQSPASPIVTGTPHPTVPSPPRAVRGQNGVGAISVSWAPPASNGGSPLSTYAVYCSTTNPPSTTGGPSALLSAKTSPLSATISPLPRGQKYYCVVTAQNVTGSSVASNVATAYSAKVPGPPTAPGASPISPTSVVVNWTPPRDGGEPIAVYFVYCSTTNPPPPTSSDVCGGANAPATGAVISGLAPGQTYYFDVIAVNEMGASKTSTVVSATTP